MKDNEYIVTALEKNQLSEEELRDITLIDPLQLGLTMDKVKEYTKFLTNKAAEKFGPRVSSEKDNLKFRQEYSSFISNVIAGLGINNIYIAAYLSQKVVDDILGLSVLEPFMKNPKVTEIEVKRFDDIYVEQEGVMIKTPARFESEVDLRNVLTKILINTGRQISVNEPILDARLPDGSRINAVVPPVSPEGTTVSIRKFTLKDISEDEYINYGSANKVMMEFLRMAVTAKIGMILSGGTGTGKTTLLNIVSSYIPSSEAIVTIEDTRELKLIQDNVRYMEARKANIEGKGEISQKVLVRNALRQRPDRIIVGEVRDGVVVDLFRAMTSGHEGSISTIHSTSPESLLRATLPQLFGESDVNYGPEERNSLICCALELIVQLYREPMTGKRRLSHITYVCGMGKEGAKVAGETDLSNIPPNKIYFKDIFRFNQITRKYEYTGYMPQRLLEKFSDVGITFNEDYLKDNKEVEDDK